MSVEEARTNSGVWFFNHNVGRSVLVISMIAVVTFIDLVQEEIVLITFYWVALMIAVTFIRSKFIFLLSVGVVALSVMTGWRWAELGTPQYLVRLAAGTMLSIVAPLLAKQNQVRDERLVSMSFTDSLTGLPNRPLFYERLESRLRQRNLLTPTVVIFIDLDNFKQINDHFGHDIGDAMLQEVGHRLTQVVRHEDTVARLGGDEFVIMCTSVADSDGAEVLCRRLIEVLHKPFLLPEHDVAGGGSVGCVIFSQGDIDPEHLVNLADVALRQAKEFHKGGYRVIDLTAAQA